MTPSQADIDLYKSFQRSPLTFIEYMWKLKPQGIRVEYQSKVEGLIKRDSPTNTSNNIFSKNSSETILDEEEVVLDSLQDIRPEFFLEFKKGENLTWQQFLILTMVERALKGTAPKKISVVSGHGVGKDATLSMLIFWYLFCFKNAQVACTAPSSDLMHDVLWKELKVWMDKMPPAIAGLFEWTNGYLRIKESPETWFARARTARKDSPEALAGMHGDYVFIAGDEASGIPEEIFKTAEGSLTGENTLVLLISNGTRNEGFFYETHHEMKDQWQTISLSSEESPIVEDDYIHSIVTKYGRESDEYNIRVAGKFPNSEQIDDKKYIPLIMETQISRVSEELDFMGRKFLGIDPSGEGDDTTVWVLRDGFMAKVVAREKTSNELSIARKTLELVEMFKINDFDIFVDNFGVGANVAKELALTSERLVVNALNWGEAAEDEETYTNKRAECFFRARNWLLKGGAICGDELMKEMSKVKYRNNLNGKKQIMDKPTMRKLMGKSPDRADAFALTFVESNTFEEHTKNITYHPLRTKGSLHDAI